MNIYPPTPQGFEDMLKEFDETQPELTDDERDEHQAQPDILMEVAGLKVDDPYKNK